MVVRKRRWILGAAIALGVLGSGSVTALRYRSPRPPGTGAPADADDPGPRWDDIVGATEAGRWAEVERLLRDRIDRHADDGRARVMFGHMLLSTSRDDEAARVLGAVRADDPSFVEARSLLGELALHPATCASPRSPSARPPTPPGGSPGPSPRSAA